ncbi:MAG: hypothetical protein ACYC4U_13350 [Pirellulaceae bacterium]
MSVGSLGIIGSAASAPLAQSQGTDVNRTQQETTSQLRQTQMGEKAESASGIGQTEQDEQASDRDADGRRPWEIGSTPSAEEPGEQIATTEDSPRQSKDPTGLTGRQLDLSG